MLAALAEDRVTLEDMICEYAFLPERRLLFKERPSVVNQMEAQTKQRKRKYVS